MGLMTMDHVKVDKLSYLEVSDVILAPLASDEQLSQHSGFSIQCQVMNRSLLSVIVKQVYAKYLDRDGSFLGNDTIVSDGWFLKRREEHAINHRLSIPDQTDLIMLSFKTVRWIDTRLFLEGVFIGGLVIYGLARMIKTMFVK